MKFEQKIKALAKELNKKELSSISANRSSLERYQKLSSFGVNLLPTEMYALAILVLEHGKDVVFKNLDMKKLTNKLIYDNVLDKANEIKTEYNEIRSDYLSKFLLSIKSNQRPTTKDVKAMFDNIKISQEEQDIYFTNVALSQVFKNEDDMVKNLFNTLCMLNLSFKAKHQDILSRCLKDLLNGEEDYVKLEECEANLNVLIAQKLKEFLGESVKRKEINKTKFLKEFSKKKKKAIFVIDLYKTNQVLEQMTVNEINAKYFILNNGNKILLNKVKYVELKFYEDRIEKYKNNILLKVSYIIKPVCFEEKLNKFLEANEKREKVQVEKSLELTVYNNEN